MNIWQQEEMTQSPPSFILCLLWGGLHQRGRHRGVKKQRHPLKKQKKNFGKRTGGDDDDEAADNDGEVDVVPITDAAVGAANDGMTEEERKVAAKVSMEM